MLEKRLSGLCGGACKLLHGGECNAYVKVFDCIISRDWDLVVKDDDMFLELNVSCTSSEAAKELWESIGTMSVEDYLAHHLKLEACVETLNIQVCANRKTYEPEEDEKAKQSQMKSGSMFVCKTDFVLAARVDQQLATEARSSLLR